MYECDKTLLPERALLAYLLRTHKQKHTSKQIYDRIEPVSTTTPRMYGVPKVYTTEVPLRPILSVVNAPQHELAMWLTDFETGNQHVQSAHNQGHIWVWQWPWAVQWCVWSYRSDIHVCSCGQIPDFCKKGPSVKFFRKWVFCRKMFSSITRIRKTKLGYKIHMYNHTSTDWIPVGQHWEMENMRKILKMISL